MWKLRGRDNKNRQWSEYGDFRDIADAARYILEREGDPSLALFFRVYVSSTPLMAVTGTTDAKILSRLEYQSENAFYLLERSVS